MMPRGDILGANDRRDRGFLLRVLHSRTLRKPTKQWVPHTYTTASHLVRTCSLIVRSTPYSYSNVRIVLLDVVCRVSCDVPKQQVKLGRGDSIG
jgi:hypothetical protein